MAVLTFRKALPLTCLVNLIATTLLGLRPFLSNDIEFGYLKIYKIYTLFLYVSWLKLRLLWLIAKTFVQVRFFYLDSMVTCYKNIFFYFLLFYSHICILWKLALYWTYLTGCCSVWGELRMTLHFPSVFLNLTGSTISTLL